MNKSEIYQYIKERGISFEITNHKAVFNMDELDGVVLPYPAWAGTNLFLRDDKKKNYYLITVKGNKRVNLKNFSHIPGLLRLSFASAEDLKQILDLTPGSVTPLGLLNDKEHGVHFYLDRAFSGHLIGIHPNDNTATIWLSADDLMQLIVGHGNMAEFVDIEE